MPSLVPIAALLASTGLAATPATPVDEVSGELSVYAAASLGESFEAIGEAFTAAHPAVELTFHFASSSDLAGQILEGAPADVFASADAFTMERLVAAGATNGRIDDGTSVFATNTLAILVEAGNPLGIAELADLADDDLIVIGGDPATPIGTYTQQVLRTAGVAVGFASYERSVGAVAARVLFGEADAGVVYVTDVLAAGDRADGIEIPADVNVVAEYPIATMAEAGDSQLAESFVDFVLDGEPQAILAAHGFGRSDTGSQSAASVPAGTRSRR